MTRDEVVKECSKAVVSCWNHYCDDKISDKDISMIACYLAEVLPLQIRTTKWDEYTKEYSAESDTKL